MNAMTIPSKGPGRMLLELCACTVLIIKQTQHGHVRKQAEVRNHRLPEAGRWRSPSGRRCLPVARSDQSSVIPLYSACCPSSCSCPHPASSPRTQEGPFKIRTTDKKRSNSVPAAARIFFTAESQSHPVHEETMLSRSICRESCGSCAGDRGACPWFGLVELF